jgi:hypothetical protein
MTNYQLPAELQSVANESVWNHELCNFYSDYYKDTNGIRPRHDISVQGAWNWIKRQQEQDEQEREQEKQDREREKLERYRPNREPVKLGDLLKNIKFDLA